MKKKIVPLLVACLIFAGLPAKALGAVSFSDINDVPWEGAKTYIQTVADAGLMTGYLENGKYTFKAKNSVTYCESAQLVYNVLSKNNSLKSATSYVSKWLNVMNGYKIPSWAHTAVSYALENGIVSINDLTKFMSGSSSNYATREDVSVFFGKALGTITSTSADSPLTFNDASKISAAAAPYVKLMVSMGILSGDTDNNFNPATKINRAEIAVIIIGMNTKTAELVNAQAGTAIRGTVIAKESLGGSVMVTVLSGTTKMGFIGDSTVFAVYENTTQQFDFTKLSLGDIITVNYNGAQILKVTMHYDAPDATTSSTTVSGTLLGIYSGYARVKAGTATKSYDFASQASYTLNGSSSTNTKISNALANYDLDVTLTLDGNEKITKLEAAYGDTAGDVTGTLRSMDEDDNEISIRKTGASKNTIYKMASSVTYKLDGSTSSWPKIETALDDAKEYPSVALTLNSSGKVTKIAVTTTDEDYDVTGTLRDMDDDEIFVRKSGASKDTAYTMASSVTYKLDGSSSSWPKIETALDAAKNYPTVKLVLNSSGKVTKMTVETGDSGEISGTLRGMDEDGDQITVRKTGTSTNTPYSLASSVTYKLNGSSADWDDIYDEYEDYGGYPEVTITLNSSNRVTKLVMTTDDDEDEIKGTLRSMDEDGEDITVLKTGTSKSKTYDLLSSATYRLNGSSSKWSKVYNAWYAYSGYPSVTIRLNDDGKVTRMELETSEDQTEGELKVFNKSYIKIRKSGKSTDDRYDFASSVTYRLDGFTSSWPEINEEFYDYDLYVTLKLNSDGEITRLEAEYD